MKSFLFRLSVYFPARLSQFRVLYLWHIDNVLSRQFTLLSSQFLFGLFFLFYLFSLLSLSVLILLRVQDRPHYRFWILFLIFDSFALVYLDVATSVGVPGML